MVAGGSQSCGRGKRVVGMCLFVSSWGMHAAAQSLVRLVLVSYKLLGITRVHPRFHKRKRNSSNCSALHGPT